MESVAEGAVASEPEPPGNEICSPITEDRKLFLGGLPQDSTIQSITNYFVEFGQVVDVEIMRDPVTKRSRGFGFVTFEDPTVVANVNSKKDHKIDGKVVEVKPAYRKGDEALVQSLLHSRKLFIGGLSQDMTPEIIKAYFNGFQNKGEVTIVDLKKDKHTSAMRGFGFIDFTTKEAADHVRGTQYHTICGKQVEVKSADPRGRTRPVDKIAVHNKFMQTLFPSGNDLYRYGNDPVPVIRHQLSIGGSYGGAMPPLPSLQHHVPGPSPRFNYQPSTDGLFSPPHPNHRLPHFIGTHNGGNTFPSYTRGGSYDHGGRAHYRRSHNPPFPPPPPSNYPTGNFSAGYNQNAGYHQSHSMYEPLPSLVNPSHRSSSGCGGISMYAGYSGEIRQPNSVNYYMGQ